MVLNFIKNNIFTILFIKIILIIIIYLILLTFIFHKIFIYFEKKFDILEIKIKTKKVKKVK